MNCEQRYIDVNVSQREFFNVKLWKFLTNRIENTKDNLFITVKMSHGDTTVHMNYDSDMRIIRYFVWNDGAVVGDGGCSKEFIISPRVLNKVRIGSVILDCEKQTFMKLDAEPNLGQ